MRAKINVCGFNDFRRRQLKKSSSVLRGKLTRQKAEPLAHSSKSQMKETVSVFWGS